MRFRTVWLFSRRLRRAVLMCYAPGAKAASALPARCSVDMNLCAGQRSNDVLRVPEKNLPLVGRFFLTNGWTGSVHFRNPRADMVTERDHAGGLAKRCFVRGGLSARRQPPLLP